MLDLVPSIWNLASCKNLKSTVDFSMQVGVFIATFLMGALLVAPVVRAADPAPPPQEGRPLETQEGEEAAEKVEQHAPTIEVGDTKRFLKTSPLSASKEGDEWDEELEDY